MANIRTKEGSIRPSDNNGLIIQGVVQIKSLLVVYSSSLPIPPSFNSGVMNGESELDFHRGSWFEPILDKKLKLT